MSRPESNHITSYERFMAEAQKAARSSEDPSTQVGACIVDADDNIVATGFNSMPDGWSKEDARWAKDGPFSNRKYSCVCHAEENALRNAAWKKHGELMDCRMFVTLFPCMRCGLQIIQHGIRHVIYESDEKKEKEDTQISKRNFDISGVKYEQYERQGSSQLPKPC